MSNLIPWLIFVAAALLEVGGDAFIRRGLRGNVFFFIIIGFVILGCYGLVVNITKWDFSKLLGIYVSVFAVISILFGRFIFKEIITTSTWIGMSVIIIGGLIIQFGQQYL